MSKMSIICILYHSISFVIFHLVIFHLPSVISQCPTGSTDIIRKLYMYENPNDPSPMQRVIVHDSTRDVFVGARNHLYVLNSNLGVKQIVSTGPKLDHPECLHPSYPCDYKKTKTDNDNKVLQVLQMSSNSILLLNCGTLYQGLCQIGRIKKPARIWVQPYNDTVAFVSGKASTVAFLAQGYNNHLSLYSASTYDGRPKHFSPSSVSSRILAIENNNYIFKYSDKTDTSFTGVNFKFKETFKVEYVTGFEHGHYAYFLATQNVSVGSGVIETRLARVCKRDKTFFSYTEVPLKCRYNNSLYNLATAAHFGVASDSLKHRLKLDKLIEVLFVSFAVTLPDRGRIVDRLQGSVICSFPISTVIASFTNATRDCFKGKSRSVLLKHVNGSSSRCKKMDEVKSYDDFCGSKTNHYIKSTESIPGGFRCHVDAQITSLATTLQNNRAVAIVGTDEGDIIKIDMDKIFTEKKEFILYSKNVARDQDDKKIQSSNAFDPFHENIHFLVGNKIVKFPIGSCSPYTNCQSCLTSDDPLMCGWCGDHCAHRGECQTPGEFWTNTCSPAISTVSPLYGPTGGGTLITVEGDNFRCSERGNQIIKTISVTVAGIPCDVRVWQKETLKCKTKPLNSDTLKGTVEVIFTISRTFFPQFEMNGTARSIECFTYLTPVLYGIYPNKGPVSGGTNITLYGSNLNIGRKRAIQVAGVPCAEIGLFKNHAWCVTNALYNGSLSETGVTSRTGPAEIHIDDTILKVENEIGAVLKFEHPLSKNFKYLPDPEIISIFPKVTTVSGIKNLTVQGKYLNSVENPRMIVNVATSVTGESLHVISDPCWFNDVADGTTMFCPTPPLQSSAFHVPTERAPLVTHVSFLMDGVQKLRELPIHEMESSKLLYYPDPELHNLAEGEDTLNISSDQTTLEIYGKYINLVLDKSDVKVFFDNVTACVVHKITAESISCLIPPLEKFKFANAPKHSVMVHTGPLVFPIGAVKFVSGAPSGSSPLPAILYVFGVLIISLILYEISRLWKKKGNSDFSIRFTSNTHPKIFKHCLAKQASIRNNYQNSSGRRMNLQKSTSSTIPEDTKHLLKSENTINPRNKLELGDINGEDCQNESGKRMNLDKSSSSTIPEEIMRLLESENIIIPRNKLTLGEIIGEGYFGCVYKGELVLPTAGNEVEVAVKTLHNSSSTIEQNSEAFLQEGLRMKDFHHHNVLTLIGVCFDSHEFPMVIIPFMKHGDLLSFIRNKNSILTIKDLLMFGVDIASGMNYLAEIKFVHRDLAARNCMLGDDQIVKVADFGLSRDIYERGYYRSDNKKTQLPVKWMAPESIEKGIYTTKSDVWAYGVVLWELMTRGVSPYPGVDNWDLLRYIKLGRRMPQPSYCPGLLYKIMMKCWDEDPDKRPTFSELQEEVEGIITKLKRKNRRTIVGLNVTYFNCAQTLPKEAKDT